MVSMLDQIFGGPSPRKRRCTCCGKSEADIGNELGITTKVLNSVTIDRHQTGGTRRIGGQFAPRICIHCDDKLTRWIEENRSQVKFLVEQDSTNVVEKTDKPKIARALLVTDADVGDKRVTEMSLCDVWRNLGGQWAMNLPQKEVAV